MVGIGGRTALCWHLVAVTGDAPILLARCHHDSFTEILSDPICAALCANAQNSNASVVRVNTYIVAHRY